MEATFTELHSQLGQRIKQLKFGKGSGGKPTLDLTTSGVFDVLPEGCPKAHITFLPLNLKAELTYFAPITAAWQILNNYSRMKATLKLKRSTSPCINLFEDDQNANMYERAKKTAKLLQYIANQKEQAREKDDDDDDIAGSAGEEAAAASSSKPPGRTLPAAPPATSRYRKRQKQSE